MITWHLQFVDVTSLFASTLFGLTLTLTLSREPSRVSWRQLAERLFPNTGCIHINLFERSLIHNFASADSNQGSNQGSPRGPRPVSEELAQPARLQKAQSTRAQSNLDNEIEEQAPAQMSRRPSARAPRATSVADEEQAPARTLSRKISRGDGGEGLCAVWKNEFVGCGTCSRFILQNESCSVDCGVYRSGDFRVLVSCQSNTRE